LKNSACPYFTAEFSPRQSRFFLVSTVDRSQL
jgi:hypothetical protein